MIRKIDNSETKIYVHGSLLTRNKNTDVFPITSELNPTVVDIELNGIYSIERVKVDTCKGYSFYSAFVSRDGVNFELACEKNDEETDDPFLTVNQKAKFLRILIKHNSVLNGVSIGSIEIYGEKTDEAYIEGKIEYPKDFSGSEYDVPITESDVFEAVRGVIERTVGCKYTDWFSFSLKESDEDFFSLWDEENKIHIEGNNGVSICAGLNYYYKNYCRVNISEVACHIEMPENALKIGEKIYRKTPFRVRYAYNYCALSYTMAFWNEDRWQKELDWLALNGANVILDITGVEEVWRRFLLKLGYGMREILGFITGPAYGAWFNMANIYGVGGPVHPNFFLRRVNLARKNHLFMRKLGMRPVFQGYNGMVPESITSFLPEAKIIKQGEWNALPRPAMLKTTSAEYKRLAAIFYECQTETFGDITEYFVADPFHEGGSSGNLNPADVSKTLLDCLIKNRNDCIWIIQSWGENPSRELLEGVKDKKDHILVLDLYAEKRPRWKNYLDREFMNTPWAYCMLNNFGGRMGLHGHVDTIASAVAEAYKEAKYMKGIGITPEAVLSNPAVFDLFFETAWGENSPEPIDADSWFESYALRRYGACPENMKESLRLLRNTVYNSKLNELGEGAPESVINARPAFTIKSASSWGNSVIAYDKAKFEKCVRLFFSCFDECKNSEGYRFDLCDLLKQVLSNRAQDCLSDMKKAYTEKDVSEFEKLSRKFLEIIRFTDSLLQGEKTFTLRNWLSGAQDWAKDTDDFTKQIYMFNAKALITTWAGDRKSAEKGGLRDYSNKQWSGLTADLYLKRWTAFTENRIRELKGEKVTEADYFDLEIRFVWDKNDYLDYDKPVDLREYAEKLFKQFK